ncbi:subunit 17 of mediator complex-domain-containing protein [Cercophora newfieldiana]|uniref:Mediator of RNA polymerase II transcription subunit 17 n=1 Tax=Cercophora newfieldiana TaxID=92897 RepID=A0AA39YNG0_9PEZI|nr:subunit 17 of mediator complex-domain-containing protein [Cercophora newfieldiana]
MAPPLALQPPPPPSRGPQSVAEFIQRVNAEPGGFRALNQNEIRKQIEARKNKGESDVEMADAEEADDEPSKTNELLAAREELMRNINAAQKTAATTLDFISLLLSKEAPVQAAATLNPELRNIVGIGTLGATALHAPTVLTQSRVPDNKMVAIGMRLQAVTKAADSLEFAAKRLEQEISLETAYWNEVRAATERGWSVFRHPDEPNTMGVKFGFSNAAPDFKANSIAPLRRAEDGSVRLEHGRMTGIPKRLQVTIMQGDTIVGQSRLPPALEDTVKEARDTVFSQELWHELNREGRELLSHNVRLRKDTVTYTEDSDKTISFRLVTLDDVDKPSEPKSRPADAEAERIYITLQLLLINAHRKNELRQSEKRNAGANKGARPTYDLLFPMIMGRQHEKTIKSCIHFLGTLCKALRRAGLNASFTMTEPPITGDSTESLANTLLNPTGAEFDLTLTPSTGLRIVAKATRPFGTRFQVFLLQPEGSKAKNPLATAYPPMFNPDPSSHDNYYDNSAKLFQYICNAVPRALAWHFKSLITPPSSSTNTESKWVIDAFNKGIVDSTTEHGIGFDYKLATDGDRVSPELHVTGDDGEWIWRAQDEGECMPLEGVVVQVLQIGGPA